MSARRSVSCRRLAVGVLLVAMALGHVPVAAQAVPTTITGRVYQESGTSPALGVKVIAVDKGTSATYEAYSGTDGSYTLFVPVSASGYRVSFDPNVYNIAGNFDYLYEYYPNVHIYGVGYPSAIGTVMANATGIDAVLEVGGRITGTVWDTTGTNPLYNVWVEAQDLGDFQGVFSQTRSDGTYVLHGIPSTVAGQVYVHFRPDYPSMSGYNASNGTNYMDEYYNNAFTLDDATPVSAGATGIDARLDEPVYIEGYVLDDIDGGEVTNVEVAAVSPASPDVVYSTAWTDDDGFYSLKVKAGTPLLLRFDATVRNADFATSYRTEWYGPSGGVYTPSAATVLYVSAAGLDMGSQYIGELKVRFEQTDAAFIGAGTWNTWANGALSGGSYQYAKGSGTSMLMQFDGSTFALIARTGPEFGKADVYLDGALAETVDFYSPTTLYKQTVFSRTGLSHGRHAVRLTWKNEKNSASTDFYINVDAIDVTVSALPSVSGHPIFEQTDAKIAFEGPWSSWSNSALSGGSYTYANTSGSAFTAVLNGDQLDLMTRTGPEFGYALVTIDDGKDIPPRLVDLYSPTTKYRQVVFSTWSLTPAAHSVRIQWTGLKNPASSGTYINVDAVYANTGLLQAYPRTEETAPAFNNGVWAWSSWANPALSGGSYQYTKTTNAETVITFQGTRLKLYARTGPEFGKMLVGCDAPATTVKDLYRITTGYQTMVYDTGVLTPGWHTVRAKCSGLKNDFASDYYISVDAVEITPASPPAISGETLVQENDPRLRPQGPWWSWSNTALLGNAYAYSDIMGAQICTEFTGTRVDVIARKGPEFGLMRVILDDGDATYLETYVDLYAPTTQYQQTVFSTWNLANARYNLSVSWVGRKNPLSTGTYVDLDALKVVGTLPAAVTRREQNDPSFSYTGPWGYWFSDLLSGGSYFFTNGTGQQCTVSGVSGSQVFLVARKGPEFGKMEVFVDGASRGTYDLYHPSTLYQQIVGGWALTPGTHSVVFKCTGQKNTASTGTYISVDRIEIAP